MVLTRALKKLRVEVSRKSKRSIAFPTATLRGLSQSYEIAMVGWALRSENQGGQTHCTFMFWLADIDLKFSKGVISSDLRSLPIGGPYDLSMVSSMCLDHLIHHRSDLSRSLNGEGLYIDSSRRLKYG
ncbi:hypothetical protein Tco_1167300 [Tanacetum coccineum]